MARNTLEDLRNHLFAALEALTDKDEPMAIERAQAVCKVSSQIIESARVEVKFLEVAGNVDERPKFFEEKKLVPALANGKAHQA